jgi:hypothetical protein
MTRVSGREVRGAVGTSLEAERKAVHALSTLNLFRPPGPDSRQKSEASKAAGKISCLAEAVLSVERGSLCAPSEFKLQHGSQDLAGS